MRWLVLAGLAGCVFLTEQDRLARTDADGDGFTVLDDCDEAAAAVFPGQDEACNGIDDDCDGEIDEGFYPDDDGDGFGDDARLGEACFVDWIRTGGDCDDGDAMVKPGAAERCDGQDNGCVEGWTPESELGVVTWVAADGDTGFEDWSEEFVGTEQHLTVSLPTTGTLSVCRGASNYTVRMVATDVDGLVVEGRAIPMEGDEEESDAWPVFNGGLYDGAPLSIDGSGWTMTVTGLNLQVGKATPSQPGSCLHAAGGARLTVEDLIASTGRAQDGTEGGNVYLQDMQDVELRNVSVRGGVTPTSDSSGGAGITVIDSTRVGIYDSVISGNEAGGFGGGMWVSNSSEVQIARTEFSENEGRKGGGAIYVDSGDLDLVDVTITGNLASNHDDLGGGGILTAGRITCASSVIQGNSSNAVGGGLRIDGAGELRSDGCVFSGNTPDDVWTDQAETLPDDTFWCGNSGCTDE